MVTGPASRTITARALLARWGYLLPPILLPLLVFLPRITGGGFTVDDWSNRTIMMHSSLGKIMDPFFADPLTHRVLHLPYVYLYDLAFTSHQRAYLLWAVLSAGIFGALVAVLLRRVRVPLWVASAIGALGAIYPYATVTKLWVTAHVGHFTGSLAILGVLLALRGLRQRRRAGRVAHHLGALLLFWISLSVYEMALPIICAGGLFYLAATVQAARAPSPDRASALRRYRPALVRWAIDVAFVLAWYLSLGGRTDIPETSDSLLDRLGVLGADGARNITGSFVPFFAQSSRPDQPVVYSGAWFGDALTVLIVAAVLSFALLCVALPSAQRRLGRRAASGTTRRVRAWGLGILVSIAAAYAGWIAIVPATAYYRPVPFDAAALRVNVIAAFGLAAVVVCTVGAAAEVLRALTVRRWRYAAPLAIAVALVAVAAAYTRHARSEVGLWNRASTEQVHILGAVKTAFDDQPPPHGATIILTDTPGYVADGAEVFYSRWSFRSALETVYDDPSLDGLPHRVGGTFQCRAEGLVPFHLQFAMYRSSPIAAYGETFLVSSGRAKKWKLTSRRSCRRALRQAGLPQIPADAETPPLGTT